MKTHTEKVYISCPLALMATIIAASEEATNSNYEEEAEKIVSHYTSLIKHSQLVFGDLSLAEVSSEEEFKSILDFTLEKLISLYSFTSTLVNDETTVYKLKCAKGDFNMILVNDSNGDMKAISFNSETTSKIQQAA